MELSLSSIELLRDVLEVVHDFARTIELQVSPDGITSTFFDEERISMLNFRLTPLNFINYKVKNPQSLNINVDQFLRCLRLARSDATAVIKRNTLDEGAEVVYFEFTRPDGSLTKTEMLLKEEDGETFEIPALMLEPTGNEVDIPSKVWEQVVSEVSAFGGVLSIEAVKDRLILSTAGHGSVMLVTSHVLAKSDGLSRKDDIKITAGAPNKNSYESRFLCAFKGSKFSHLCHVNLPALGSTGKPLNVTYKLGKGNGDWDLGHMILLLAAKVDDE